MRSVRRGTKFRVITGRAILLSVVATLFFGSLLQVLKPEHAYAQSVLGKESFTLDVPVIDEWDKYGADDFQVPKITLTITTFGNPVTKVWGGTEAKLDWEKPRAGSGKDGKTFEYYKINWKLGTDPKVRPNSWLEATQIRDFNQTTYSFRPAAGSLDASGTAYNILFLQITPFYKSGTLTAGSGSHILVADMNNPENPKISYISVRSSRPNDSNANCPAGIKDVDGVEIQLDTGIHGFFVESGPVDDIVCWMMQSVTNIVDFFINWGIKNFLFPAIGLSGVEGGKPISENLKTTTLVKNIWKINIVLVDTILILALIFLAIVNIARVAIDTYSIKKILPTLILATILAHFSILITQLIIESSEVLVVNFVPGNIETMSRELALAVGWPGLYTAVGGLIAFVPFGGWVLSIVFTIAPIILILVLAFMMWLRHLALFALVAFAPLAIIMMALPVTEKIFKQWLNIFIRVTYLSTIAVIFLFYSTKFGLAGIETKADSFLESLSGYFFAVVFLGLAIFVPISIGKGVPGLGSVFGGIGNALKKGGKLVGTGAGKKADTMFAGLSSGNANVGIGKYKLGAANRWLGKFAPLKAIGVGSSEGTSAIGLYKGWQQRTDGRWNQRIGKQMGRGEDINEMLTHLHRVIGLTAGGRRQRGDAWKQISEAANSRFEETRRTQLLTESRTMADDQLTSDSQIEESTQTAIRNGDQHEAQRGLLAARSRNLPNSDNLWQQYLNKFDKNVGDNPKGRQTVSLENLAFQEMLAFEAEKNGGFHEQRFGVNDKGQIVRRGDNEVTDLLVNSARKQLNRTTGKQRQQIVKNIIIHAAENASGLLSTPADAPKVGEVSFSPTKQAMREVLVEHFPGGGIEQAAGTDTIQTGDLKNKVDIKEMEKQLSQESLDLQREGRTAQLKRKGLHQLRPISDYRRGKTTAATETVSGMRTTPSGGEKPPQGYYEEHPL